MEQHINYITLGVSDLPASRRFYREVFGWQENENSNEHIAFFQTGGALVFALFARDSLAADAHLSAASPSGFPRFTLAQKVFWGGYSGYIADPDGFLWEIAYNPFLQKLR